MRQLLSKLFHGRRALSADLENEINSHIELRADENIARGIPPDAAVAEARRHFGNTAVTRENAREAWHFPRIETIFQDLRYGMRGACALPASHSP